jgi:two-component system response regulator QseB
VLPKQEASMLTHAHVLVADDDPQLLDAVAEALTTMGADVSRATSGAELIDQVANAGPFDLVVTDVGMPWMNGLQAIRSTRAAGLATSVIIMTALADAQLPAQVEALGKHAVLLHKPFELAELEAAASTLLAAKTTGSGRSETAIKESEDDAA